MTSDPETTALMRWHTFRCRWIGRYDDRQRLVRIGRAVWQRGKVGDGKGYSVKLSLGLRPRLWQFRREMFGVIVTALGVRVHYARSYGGIDV